MREPQPKSLAVRERYEHACESYDELYKSEQAEKFYIAVKHAKPRGVVLDAGCGTGLLAEFLYASGLAENVELYICLDYSSCMLEIARRRLESLGLKHIIIEACVEDMPLDSKTADTTYSITVLNLLDDPTEGLRELRRVSRGRIVVSVLRDANITPHLLENGCKILEASSKDDILEC